MKMKKVICLLIGFCVVLMLSSTLCMAQELTVEEMTFCTAIEERQPAGVDTAFSSTVERVYCFSKITGATDTVTVFHVWYHNDQEMAKVELTIKGKSWRTWSSKRIMQEWQGKWKVDIVTSNGDILMSKEFTIKP
jgi:hypothetical protein